MENFLGLPPDGSAHGPQIDYLIGLIHWVMFALFVGWGIYFTAILIRFRSSKQKKASYHGVKSHFSTYIEAGVIVVEAILLVVFSIPMWAERVDAFPSEQSSTVVRIVAEQFAWNIHYPGADGVFGKTTLTLVGTDNPLGLDRSDPAAQDDITTINQLNLPLGKPVLMYLTSKDVIHSLNLTAFRVKQDAIPGLSIPVWFVPTKTSAQIRAEMASSFSVEGALSSTATITLPAVEDVALSAGFSRNGYFLTADVNDAEGSTILSEGDDLSADNVALLMESGVTSVRARAAARLDGFLTAEAVIGGEGNVILPKHETLSVEAVTTLVNAGISAVSARKRSAIDPWILNESLSATDGSVIAAPGDYLTEEVISAAAAAGRRSIAVAPASPTEIACAQLCGLGHYRMRGYIDVLSPEAYGAWFDVEQTALREQFGVSDEHTSQEAASADGTTVQ